MACGDDWLSSHFVGDGVGYVMGFIVGYLVGNLVRYCKGVWVGDFVGDWVCYFVEFYCILLSKNKTQIQNFIHIQYSISNSYPFLLSKNIK